MKLKVAQGVISRLAEIEVKKTEIAELQKSGVTKLEELKAKVLEAQAAYDKHVKGTAEVADMKTRMLARHAAEVAEIDELLAAHKKHAKDLENATGQAAVNMSDHSRNLGESDALLLALEDEKKKLETTLPWAQARIERAAAAAAERENPTPPTGEPNKPFVSLKPDRGSAPYPILAARHGAKRLKRR